MAGHSIPLMTRTDAKVNKTALALERSLIQTALPRTKEVTEGWRISFQGRYIYVWRNKYRTRKVYQNLRGCGVLMSACPFPQELGFVCFLINESQTLAHRPLSQKQMDDIPYLMVLFSVK